MTEVVFYRDEKVENIEAYLKETTIMLRSACCSGGIRTPQGRTPFCISCGKSVTTLLSGIAEPQTFFQITAFTSDEDLSEWFYGWTTISNIQAEVVWA